MAKTFQAAQLTHEIFLTIDHSFKIFFWYLSNWTSTDLWCLVLYVTYSTTHQRSVEVQFGRYQKNILQEWCRVKKLSCVSCGSLKRFPHTFTNDTRIYVMFRLAPSNCLWKVAWIANSNCCDNLIDYALCYVWLSFCKCGRYANLFFSNPILQMTSQCGYIFS